jgi:D-alanyl-D-alanine carboxypeptidase
LGKIRKKGWRKPKSVALTHLRRSLPKIQTEVCPNPSLVAATHVAKAQTHTGGGFHPDSKSPCIVSKNFPNHPDPILIFPLLNSSKPFALPLLLLGSLSVGAAKAQSPVLVVDASTGQVLISEDATRPWNPASTTKMMTAYVALRAVKSGVARMDTPLIASANAAGQKPSKIGIRPGQEITLDNAIKIIMVKSANDVAVVIAEGIGGSVSNFSAMMNAEARRLGMNESRFLNPHGFHADGHQTSARDLALLARAMLNDFPEYSDYWGIGAVQLGNKVMNNTNGLIGRYAGATGFKTGFVCASGFNLVSMATRGGRTLIAVVLGASSGGDRVIRSAQLLDQGFGTWGGNGQTLRSLPASGYSSAPNMRSQICSGRRRGVVLADDSDYGGSIFADSASGDSMGAGSPLAFFSMQAGTPQRGYGVRGSGRGLLGPRSGITPISVSLGRAPGSTAVAMGPGGRRVAPATAQAAVPAQAQQGSIPATASALAATGQRGSAAGSIPGLERSPLERPSAASAIRPAASQQARTAPAERSEDVSAPLQLHGVVTSVPRPSAAASIRSRPAAIKQPDSRQAQTAADKKRTTQPAKASAPKASAQKAAPKAGKKPVGDDE